MISNTSLISDMYRKLLLKGRTYASFTENELSRIIQEVSYSKEILDPMSGYGGLMQFCAPRDISTCNIELNPPAFLWQILTNPQNKNRFSTLIERILEKKSSWPVFPHRIIVSKNWFSEELLIYIDTIYNFILSNITTNKKNAIRQDYICLALLLPFVARLSCSVNGDVTHIKKGGFCVLNNWEKDFEDYLNTLTVRLNTLPSTKVSTHTNLLGDITNLHYVQKTFSSFVTSPPYPNYRDYGKMFAPENYYLAKRSVFTKILGNIIGSNIVKGRLKQGLNSEIGRAFLYKLSCFKTSIYSAKQIQRYYIPYFENYFSDLEKAYYNISTMLSQNSIGFIIVVNNTTRNLVVPVAEMTMEVWKTLGYRSEVVESSEQYHIGTKNPYSKGLKAKHSKYTIKVWKK